jgi:hypothetical protein
LRKFMVDFDEKVFRELDKDAKSRNITFQAFLRSVGHSRMNPRRNQNDVQSSSDS